MLDKKHSLFSVSSPQRGRGQAWEGIRQVASGQAQIGGPRTPSPWSCEKIPPSQKGRRRSRPGVVLQKRESADITGARCQAPSAFSSSAFHDNPYAFGAGPFLRGNCRPADAQQFFHSALSPLVGRGKPNFPFSSHLPAFPSEERDSQRRIRIETGKTAQSVGNRNCL